MQVTLNFKLFKRFVEYIRPWQLNVYNILHYISLESEPHRNRFARQVFSVWPSSSKMELCVSEYWNCCIFSIALQQLSEAAKSPLHPIFAKYTFIITTRQVFHYAFFVKAFYAHNTQRTHTTSYETLK